MNDKLFAHALKYLARRPRSEKEVVENLQKKKATEKEIAEILQRLYEHTFLDDTAFAKWWIEQRTRFNTKGKRAIEIELKNKGISSEILEELRSKYQELRGKTEKELGIELIERRVKKYQGMTRDEIYRKVGGFLARRGFDFDTIKACIDEVIKKSV